MDNFDNDNQICGLQAETQHIQNQINNIIERHELPPPLVRQYGVRDDYTRDEWVNYYRLTNIALTHALNHMLLQVQQAE